MAAQSGAGTPGTANLSGPCGAARLAVDTRCAEAEGLAQAAVAHQQRLRDARRQLLEVSAQRDADTRVRDRRQLGAAKDAARTTYHRAMVVAPDRGAVHEAARAWLRELDRLNRQLALADRRSEDITRQLTELERALPGIELAADAARIAAETAQAACLDARRALAACEEEAQRRFASAAQPGAAQPAAGGPAAAPRAATSAEAPAATKPSAGAGSSPRAISVVLRGDREALLGLALRLAEESGVEAGRLQLLLIELREAIATRALETHALRFPASHPFWSQFPNDGSRRIAESLAAMGYRFDGKVGWVDGRAPTIRELALALSHVGLDPRGLRRPASQQAIDELWRGTTVVVEEFIAACAPELELTQVMACLGPRAARLSELWDMWGRLRPLLLGSSLGQPI